MKLIIAIVQNEDADDCADALQGNGVVYTRLASVGGFLARESTTLLVGVADDRVDEVVDLIRNCARERTQVVDTNGAGGHSGGMFIPSAMDVQVGGATVFVVPVDAVIRL